MTIPKAEIICRDLPPNPAIAANREWLARNSGKYVGKWLAVRNGELLGVEDSLKELLAKIPNDHHTLYTKGR